MNFFVIHYFFFCIYFCFVTDIETKDAQERINKKKKTRIYKKTRKIFPKEVFLKNESSPFFPPVAFD